jgi:membrane protease YdiL (CAAX protease family)
MPVQSPTSQPRSLIARHPVAVFFALTYVISWTGALVVAVPYLLRNQAVPKMAGLFMFPAMLLGPCLVGIALTWATGGRGGLKDLLFRMGRTRLSVRWYATLFIPPAVVMAVLFGLQTFVSPVFAPNTFFVGASFGFIAGFFEEIGWMGYAFPRMNPQHSVLGSGVLLGLLWGVWHLPVVDYLGTATPHGSYWLPYFMAFIAVMTAMRVLIGWTYSNTKSVALAQLTHASSTGSLVVLSPAGVTAKQEALWYAVYAVALWIVVALVVLKASRTRVDRMSHCGAPRVLRSRDLNADAPLADSNAHLCHQGLYEHMMLTS